MSIGDIAYTLIICFLAIVIAKIIIVWLESKNNKEKISEREGIENSNVENKKEKISKSKKLLIIGLVFLELNIFSVAGQIYENGLDLIHSFFTSLDTNAFAIIGKSQCYFAYKNKY